MFTRDWLVKKGSLLLPFTLSGGKLQVPESPVNIRCSIASTDVCHCPTVFCAQMCCVALMSLVSMLFLIMLPIFFHIRKVCMNNVVNKNVVKSVD